MNDRIKELALDAGIGFTLWDDSGREMIDNYTPEEQLEKFAELLEKEFEAKHFSAGYIAGRSDGTIETVRECISICNQAILQNQDTLSKLNEDELAEKMIIHGSINQAQKLGKGIKEHFGVEE